MTVQLHEYYLFPERAYLLSWNAVYKQSVLAVCGDYCGTGTIDGLIACMRGLSVRMPRCRFNLLVLPGQDLRKFSDARLGYENASAAVAAAIRYLSDFSPVSTALGVSFGATILAHGMEKAQCSVPLIACDASTEIHWMDAATQETLEQENLGMLFNFPSLSRMPALSEETFRANWLIKILKEEIEPMTEHIELLF